MLAQQRDHGQRTLLTVQRLVGLTLPSGTTAAALVRTVWRK